MKINRVTEFVCKNGQVLTTTSQSGQTGTLGVVGTVTVVVFVSVDLLGVVVGGFVAFVITGVDVIVGGPVVVVVVLGVEVGVVVDGGG